MKLKIPQAAEVRSGRQRAPQFESGDDAARYLRSANIDENGINVDDVKSMNFTPDEQRIFELRPGDVLLTEGSGSRSAVGQSGEVPDFRDDQRDSAGRCALSKTPHGVEAGNTNI